MLEGLASCGVLSYSFIRISIIRRRASRRRMTAALYGMMLLDCIIFMVLAWYFSKSCLSEFGKPKPYCFPFLPSTYMSVPPKVETATRMVEGCPSDAYEERAGGEPVVVVRADKKHEFQARVL